MNPSTVTLPPRILDHGVPGCYCRPARTACLWAASNYELRNPEVSQPAPFVTLMDMMKMYCALTAQPLGQDSQARAGRQFTMLQAAKWCVKWGLMEDVVDQADPWTKKWRLTTLGEAVLWHDIVYGVILLADRRHYMLMDNTIHYLSVLCEHIVGPENSLWITDVWQNKFMMPNALEPSPVVVSDLGGSGLLDDTWSGWLPGLPARVEIPSLLNWASLIFQKRNLPF